MWSSHWSITCSAVAAAPCSRMDKRAVARLTPWYVLALCTGIPVLPDHWFLLGRRAFSAWLLRTFSASWAHASCGTWAYECT